MAYARAFNGIAFLGGVLDQIAHISGERPKTYGANYEKEWKTWEGFSNGSSKLPELAFADFFYPREGLLCVYENSLVGFYKPPAVGSLSLTISCPESLCSVQQLLDLAKAVYPSFPFEYGYAHSLTDDFEPTSEIKFRRTFGGRSMKVGPASSTWLYHMVGIRHGFLRSVYPKNILNSSQTSNTIVANLQKEGVGQLEPFVADLQLWSISDDQIPGALEVLSTSGSLIWDDKGRDIFLRRNEAREYHEAMFPKRA
ncbi:MAG TPA: hypothetical protein VK629_13095 [Steroidobacteraceae bacterium]|nr:hypothetical protein [Steroidobacteraceae bacterium]